MRCRLCDDIRPQRDNSVIFNQIHLIMSIWLILIKSGYFYSQNLKKKISGWRVTESFKWYNNYRSVYK